MRSARFDRFLASTALIVLLAGAQGAFAQAPDTSATKAPTVSDVTSGTPATGSDPAQVGANPAASRSRTLRAGYLPRGEINPPNDSTGGEFRKSFIRAAQQISARSPGQFTEHYGERWKTTLDLLPEFQIGRAL